MTKKKVLTFYNLAFPPESIFQHYTGNRNIHVSTFLPFLFSAKTSVRQQSYLLNNHTTPFLVIYDHTMLLVGV